MNFSKAYEQESFFEKKEVNWIDCTDIEETNCYCSIGAEKKLNDRVQHISEEGLHFIDSGNYHYVSGIWMNRLHTPFDLVLIDHHPDMQLPCFGNILSCGGWVKQFMDTNPFVSNVILIDIDKELFDNDRKENRFLKEENLYYFSKEDILQNKRIHWGEKKNPIYISLDKDVLNKTSARTDWSQGAMDFKELKLILEILFRDFEVIGMDICGEAVSSINNSDSAVNDTTNQKLINMIDIIFEK